MKLAVAGAAPHALEQRQANRRKAATETEARLVDQNSTDGRGANPRRRHG